MKSADFIQTDIKPSQEIQTVIDTIQAIPEIGNKLNLIACQTCDDGREWIVAWIGKEQLQAE